MTEVGNELDMDVSSGGIYTDQLKKVLGLPLSVCLQDLIQIMPQDPLEFIALWLYKYANNTLYYNEQSIFYKDVFTKLQKDRWQRKATQTRVKTLNFYVWGFKRTVNRLSKELQELSKKPQRVGSYNKIFKAPVHQQFGREKEETIRRLSQFSEESKRSQHSNGSYGSEDTKSRYSSSHTSTYLSDGVSSDAKSSKNSKYTTSKSETTSVERPVHTELEGGVHPLLKKRRLKLKRTGAKPPKMLKEYEPEAESYVEPAAEAENEPITVLEVKDNLWIRIADMYRNRIDKIKKASSRRRVFKAAGIAAALTARYKKEQKVAEHVSEEGESFRDYTDAASNIEGSKDEEADGKSLEEQLLTGKSHYENDVLGAKIYSSENDVLGAKMYSAENDVLGAKMYSSENDVLAYLDPEYYCRLAKLELLEVARKIGEDGTLLETFLEEVSSCVPSSEDDMDEDIEKTQRKKIQIKKRGKISRLHGAKAHELQRFREDSDISISFPEYSELIKPLFDKTNSLTYNHRYLPFELPLRVPVRPDSVQPIFDEESDLTEYQKLQAIQKAVLDEKNKSDLQDLFTSYHIMTSEKADQKFDIRETPLRFGGVDVNDDDMLQRYQRLLMKPQRVPKKSVDEAKSDKRLKSQTVDGGTLEYDEPHSTQDQSDEYKEKETIWDFVPIGYENKAIFAKASSQLHEKVQGKSPRTHHKKEGRISKDHLDSFEEEVRASPRVSFTSNSSSGSETDRRKRYRLKDYDRDYVEDDAKREKQYRRKDYDRDYVEDDAKREKEYRRKDYDRDYVEDDAKREKQYRRKDYDRDYVKDDDGRERKSHESDYGDSDDEIDWRYRSKNRRRDAADVDDKREEQIRRKGNDRYRDPEYSRRMRGSRMWDMALEDFMNEDRPIYRQKMDGNKALSTDTLSDKLQKQKSSALHVSSRSSKKYSKVIGRKTFRLGEWYFIKHGGVMVFKHPLLGELRSCRKKRTYMTYTYDCGCESMYDHDLYTVCDPFADDDEYKDVLAMKWDGMRE